MLTLELILLSLSCSNEPEATFVDFSKRVVTSHPVTKQLLRAHFENEGDHGVAPEIWP